MPKNPLIVNDSSVAGLNSHALLNGLLLDPLFISSVPTKDRSGLPESVKMYALKYKWFYPAKNVIDQKQKIAGNILQSLSWLNRQQIICT